MYTQCKRTRPISKRRITYHWYGSVLEWCALAAENEQIFASHQKCLFFCHGSTLPRCHTRADLYHCQGEDKLLVLPVTIKVIWKVTVSNEANYTQRNSFTRKKCSSSQLPEINPLKPIMIDYSTAETKNRCIFVSLKYYAVGLCGHIFIMLC